MDQVNAYPQWKILAWRALRVFSAAFIGFVAVDVSKNCQIDDVFGCVTSYADLDLLKVLASAGVSAGLAAIMNWLRTDKPFNSFAHKFFV